MQEMETIEWTPALIGAQVLGSIGFLIWLVTWIILMVKAFNKSAGWGILVLLLSPFCLPIGAIIFGATNFEKVKGPFITLLVGYVLYLAGSIMIGTNPQFMEQFMQIQEEMIIEEPATSGGIE